MQVWLAAYFGDGRCRFFVLEVTRVNRIGVISDVHGNLPALQAILAELHRLGCQEIIHTGDVVDIGPSSLECFKLLMQHNVLCLMGNHDRDFLRGQTAAKPMSHVSEVHKVFTFNTLKGNEEAFAHFPYYAVRTCGGKTIIFEHYCRPQDYLSRHYPFDALDPNPTAEKFDKMYAHYQCDAVFFGHKHEPCDLQGDRLYVDIGSVGCHENPLARAIVIDYDDETWSYTRVSVPYDMDLLVKQMTDGSVPSGRYLLDFYFFHTITD